MEMEEVDRGKLVCLEYHRYFEIRGVEEETVWFHFFFFLDQVEWVQNQVKMEKKMEIRHDLILDYFIDYYNQLFYFSFFLTFSFLRKRLFEIRYTVERYLYILLLSRE